MRQPLARQLYTMLDDVQTQQAFFFGNICCVFPPLRKMWGRFREITFGNRQSLTRCGRFARSQPECGRTADFAINFINR